MAIATTHKITVSPTRTGPYVFPMQGRHSGGKHIEAGWITWDDALEIYRYYVAVYGYEQSLQRLGERSGFCPGEYEACKRDYERLSGQHSWIKLPTMDQIRSVAGECYAPYGKPITSPEGGD